MGSLVLAEAPQVTNHIGEQTRFGPLQFPEALAGDGPGLPVRPEIGAVDNRQQEFDQRRRFEVVGIGVGRYGDEN